MAYGTIKVDTITYTNGGVDASTTVSGLVNGTFSNISITGTISGGTITGNVGEFGTLTAVTGIFINTLSGSTVTGSLARFTTVTGGTAGFTTITGQTITGTASQFGTVTGNTAGFTTVTGQTVTGTAGQFGTITGNTAGFTTVTGQTVTGTVGRFGTITGNTAGFTTVTGQTVTGSIAQFTTITGSTAGFTTITGQTVTGALASFTSGVFAGSLLTDPEIVGTIKEDVYTISDGAAFEVDPGNGSVQLITLGASRTPKATNFAAGESVTLMVNDGSSYTLTWTDATWGTSGVIWTGGSAPALAATGYTVIQFWKVSTQVYGAKVGDVT